MSDTIRIIAYVIISMLVSLLLSACLERTEEITVRPDGSTEIRAEFSGNAGSFGPPISLPAEPEWEIVQRQVDSSTQPEPKITLQAKKVIPYGEPFPETFAARDYGYRDLALRFPTSLRRWTEGNRTYYEFTRTYKARTFDAFNVSEMDPFWDRELEQLVIDSGLLALPEDQRDKYLSDFTFAYIYQHWRFMWESLMGLAREGLVDPERSTATYTSAADHLDSTLTEDVMLGIIREEDEETMQESLDSLDNAIRAQLRSIVAAALESGKTEAMKRYDELYDRARVDYRITEALSGHEFSVHLFMPGTIIETNGLVEIDEPSGVIWWFKGDELHDADLTLRAVSVVEK
jgi:hypothetical protein